MGYYKVLSDPMPGGPLGYKGLYRDEPPYPPIEDVEIVRLWYRYADYVENGMGVTSELTLSELKRFAEWFNHHTDARYEVAYFDETGTCPHEAVYYGTDVAGFGGYSLLGEAFFDDNAGDSARPCTMDVVIRYFRERLNENSLFSCLDDAIMFRGVLQEWKSVFHSSVEGEDWRVVHVFRVI